MIALCALALFGFFLTFLVTPLFLKLAHKLSFVDVPDNALKLHQSPVPCLGGVILFLVTTVSFFLWQPHIVPRFFILGLGFLLALGLIDDRIAIGPLHKLVGQSIAALLLMFGGGFYLKLAPLFSLGGLLGVALSFLWLVSLMNAFNLVDVMDGLALLIALIGSVALLIVSAATHTSEVTFLLSIFMGPLFGLAYYNFPPAQIYLGDAGSLFIGGYLGTIALMLPWDMFKNGGLIAPLVIFAIPLVEMLSLIIIRTKKKIPFYQGSRHHFSHYLLYRGLSREKILVCVGVFSGASLLGLFAFLNGLLGIAGFIAFLLFLLLAWTLFVFSKQKA